MKSTMKIQDITLMLVMAATITVMAAIVATAAPESVSSGTGKSQQIEAPHSDALLPIVGEPSSQGDLRVWELPHGWIVTRQGGAQGMIFVPKPPNEALGHSCPFWEHMGEGSDAAEFQNRFRDMLKGMLKDILLEYKAADIPHNHNNHIKHDIQEDQQRQ